MPLKSISKHVIHVHSSCCSCGAAHKTKSPRSQGRQASCLNCSWCHLHTFQKSDWNIFLSVPRRQGILSLQSPANVLTQPNCPPERPLERHERMPASSKALMLLAGGFPLPLYHFLPHLGPLLHGYLMKTRAACLPASLMQHRILHPFSSFSTYAPWPLSPTLPTYAVCWLSFLGPWQWSWWHTMLPSDCLGGHRRSALVDLPRLTTEQLIKKGDYFSWKRRGKHHQYFNYQMSAASHGTIATKHTHFYYPPFPRQTMIFILWYHFWHQVMLKTRLNWIFINGIIFFNLKMAECVNNFEYFLLKSYNLQRLVKQWVSSLRVCFKT